MNRCDSCATEVITVDPNGDGIKCGCALYNPLERAAIARYKHSAPGAISWEEATEEIRKRVRKYARDILTAAIDVDELAEHIGTEHAAAVRTHFLGANDD